MKTIHRLINSKLRVATFVLASLCNQNPLVAAEKLVASFDNDKSLESWTSVNDGVMGGVSKGGFKRSDQGTLVFSGELSLANNGGFASIRMKPGELGLAGTSGIVIKARGDGRTYWVDLRLANQPPASSYRAYLATTAGEWKKTRIPFEDFKLQAFGQDLPSKEINPESINSVGFTLADKKEGAFSLEIESVKATGNATLLKADITASNGIIHVIDQVLIPQATQSKPLNASQLMELAIERGVPIFNNGDIDGCAAIYEVTIEALRTMESVPKASRKVLAQALGEARGVKSSRERAWILRKAIDTTRQSLNE